MTISIAQLKESRGFYSEEKYQQLLDEIYEANADLIALRQQNVLKHTDRPRVGEVVIRSTGEEERFTYAWAEGIQAGGALQGRGFYLYDDGGASYSGGLNSSIPYENLELTEELREVRFWTFDRNSAGANNGIDYSLKVRVWREVKKQ